MPSKLSIHLSGYPNTTYDVIAKMQPTILKVFNQTSEMNIDAIRQVTPRTLIIYRQYTNQDYHGSADAYFAELSDTFNKMRGRGIIWEGLHEPNVQTSDDAKALNAWTVRFAQLVHAQGELVSGFSWLTGDPVSSRYDQIIPYITDAAAAVDFHAFEEYYTSTGKTSAWGKYRDFEAALPISARKPVIITEAGWEDNSDPYAGGYKGRATDQQYLDILKQYDALLMQDPYVLGATIAEWGDGALRSVEMSSLINLFADYVASSGGGVVINKPYPILDSGNKPHNTLTVAPATISAGQSATLTWSCSNATQVTLDGQTVAASGSRVVTPTASTTYTLNVVNADGSTELLQATVTVVLGTTPRITNVSFSPTSLRGGELLNVSITVRNDSAETLQTQGPQPGFVYNEGDTFYSRGYAETPGTFRVGIDFDGRTGIDHPYRWGLPAPLAPGQSATITGTIRLQTPRAINYWAGLVRERVAWLQDKQGAQSITVAAMGTPRITAVTLTPASLVVGDVLNVSITVANDSGATLQTQGPNPGFEYAEGDTFRSRGFTETNGSYRVGIDFDGRTGIDHSYRWGLGAPLAPGQSATITGTIRLQTPRAINYWAGLVREQIAWMQDRQNVQTITVTPVVVPPPQPTFTASPTLINPGQTSTLTWDATGATSVTLNAQAVALQGSQIVSPTQTTTYTLHIIYPDNTARDLIQTITVVAIPQPTFTATPVSIQVGQASTLTWDASGATSVTLNGQPVAILGSQIVTPPQTTTYTLHLVYSDQSTRDLTLTVTVIANGTMRPPTVPITPENVAFLRTFPRPANDNGRGLHFNIDLRDTTNANTVAHLSSIGCKWTMIYTPDELQAKRAAQAAWNAGIMPIVRIGKKVDEPFDPVLYVNALKAVGAPPYVQVYNEPGDDREWRNKPADWVGSFGGRWALMASIIFDAGGNPGLQVLGKEEFYAAINAVKANHRTDIFQRTFFALHNYGANHPPAYPYDPRNQQDHPGATILTDDVATLNFLTVASWMKDAIGFVLPIIGGEGGWEFGAQEDNRYPAVAQPFHGQYHATMFDWFRTGVLANGEPLPDYLFSITPWIEGGWGADDWWGGVLGDKTETINAVASLPSFVRRFSWDGTPAPSPAASFTASRATVNPGDAVTLEWFVTGATQVKLDGAAVAMLGAQTVMPTQTTTYTLHVVFTDNSTRDLAVTIAVVAPIPSLTWDPRLDALGVTLTRAVPSPAWRVISALYQDETQSSGNHNVYFTLLKADGTPASGVTVVVDWIGRGAGDSPAQATTDANGEANIALWAVMHPEQKDGPYFAFIKNAASDQVAGMGLPVARHVNFLLTFRLI